MKLQNSFSVVIPTMNEEENITLLFRDIQKQTMQPNEIIIADAHSTDGTVHVAKKFGAIVVEGGLPGIGRNKGAEIAQSEILIFFDADIRLFDKNFLENAMNEFTDRALGIATADLKPMSENWFDIFGHKVYNWLVRRWAKKKPHAAGSFIMVRKDVHDAIGGFDEEILLGEDRVYTLQAGNIAKYAVLNTVEVNVSVRRMTKDGRIRTVITYIIAEIHMRFIGSIKHNKFHYNFRYEKKKKI